MMMMTTKLFGRNEGLRDAKIDKLRSEIIIKRRIEVSLYGDFNPPFYMLSVQRYVLPSVF